MMLQWQGSLIKTRKLCDGHFKIHTYLEKMLTVAEMTNKLDSSLVTSALI